MFVTKTEDSGPIDQPDKLRVDPERSPEPYGTERNRTSQIEESLEVKSLAVSRISRTVAGGRRLRFRAVVIAGNRQGRVGMGVAKGNDVNTAVKKATTLAKKKLFSIHLKDRTIPYPISTSFGSTTVYLKPAPAGSSIIAGGSARVIFELAGIDNISCKIIGSTNKINVAHTTLKALKIL